MSEIEQIEHLENAGGNTGTPAKQSPQYLYWSFTWNNYGTIEQIERIERALRHECKWFIMQQEKGDNGTPHVQGTLCLKERQRLTQLKPLEQSIHWKPTKCVRASQAYCSKEETRDGLQWIYGIEVPETVRVTKPYGWQLEVMDIIKTEPDDRTIHWFWDKAGGVGKTSLCKYLCVKHNALILTGKSNDMFHMLAKFPNKRKIIVVNCPRSQQDFINYGAIEAIKDGLICSGKYEGAQLVFNYPHVFVFANIPPGEGKMSDDKWHVVEINTQTRISDYDVTVSP